MKQNTDTTTRVIPTLQNGKQMYEAYTEEDQLVWNMLFTRQYKNLPAAASQAFLDGLRDVQFTDRQIPDFDDVNKILSETTGWNIVGVPGIVDDDRFFELMADRKFPCTTWLRSLKQLDYLEEPDMFHDVFAHVPLLANAAFAEFLHQLSEIGLEHIHDKHAIHLLSRIYWYTVEFGLIQEKSGTRIYGAGVLSSAGETTYSLSDPSRHRQFGVHEILQTSYRKDTFQEVYFVINSLEDLYNSIPVIRAQLNKLP